MSTSLTLLLDRLLWPSCLVKERACRELAGLLNQPSPPPGLDVALENWIAGQPLETTCAYGLLVLLRAKLDRGTVHAEKLSGLARSLKSPSLLAALLLKELGLTVGLSEFAVDSGEVPQDFAIPDFFSGYVQRFLPPVYCEWAEWLDVTIHGSFIRHWAFEPEQANGCCGAGF